MLIEDYARYQRSRGFSERTIARRTTTLTLFAKLVAPAGPNDATMEDVENFLASKTSARTRHAYRSDLRTFYNWAIRRGLLTNDPTVLIDPIKVPKSLPRPLYGDLDGLMLVGRIEVRRMVALGLYAGLRCAEIAVLDGSDIHLHVIPPVLVVRDGKGAKDRVVPIRRPLVPLLRDAPRSGPVFPNHSTGRPVKAKSVSAAIKRHLQACEVDGVPHQLRHTFGTTAAQAAGGDLQAVAVAMGHGSLETTKGYAAFDGGRLAPMFERMDGGDAA
jgi:integrase/recombinase XerD